MNKIIIAIIFTLVLAFTGCDTATGTGSPSSSGSGGSAINTSNTKVPTYIMSSYVERSLSEIKVSNISIYIDAADPKIAIFEFQYTSPEYTVVAITAPNGTVYDFITECLLGGTHKIAIRVPISVKLNMSSAPQMWFDPLDMTKPNHTLRITVINFNNVFYDKLEVKSIPSDARSIKAKYTFPGWDASGNALGYEPGWDDDGNPWTAATAPEGWYLDPVTGKWMYKAPTPIWDDNGNAS